MKGQLNPLSRLFEDSRPAVWLPPPGYSAQERKTATVTGVAAFLSSLPDPKEQHPPVTKTRLQLQREERQARTSRQQRDLATQRAQWNPRRDEKIRGEPQCTIIIARLLYATTAEDIEGAFAQFGSIEHVRVVPNRGYAFVVFSHPQDARAAIQNTASGLSIRGRRVLTDFEKGRTQKSWLPRRLGGGLGGRFSLARQKAEMQRAQNIQRGMRNLKRDSRGATRGGTQDRLTRRDGRDPGHKEARWGPSMYDPRRGPPRPHNGSDEKVQSSAVQRPHPLPRSDLGGRALRRY